MMSQLAEVGYVPFLHPMSWVHDWWYLLLIPLSFGISIIYKALRMAALRGFWWQVTMMTAQVIIAMIGLSICLIVLVQVIIPMLPVE